jgi:D-alanine-D-alanine ligase
MAGLPYVGCSVAASALAMDKALAKKIFESANIPQAPYVVATVFQWQEDRDRVISAIEEMLGYAVFVKPANLGSSVGVSKAKTRNELVTAIELALEFDRKVVVEMSMENCHEIECAILGNENPQASVLGEIIPGAEFYNYETKYIDDKSRSIIPAPLDAATTARVQALSIEAFKAIDGNGLARVDFFVHKDSGDIILNEVNTLPGFTPISMYPQLWAASGIPYPELIDRLIELAMENHRTKQSLKRAF